MGKQIAWTLVILIGIAMLTGVHRMVDYEISQSYAVSAVDQLTDDNTYTLLKSEKAVHNMVFFVYCTINIVLLLLLYRVWTPYKRVTKRKKKEMRKKAKERRKNMRNQE